MSIEAIFNGLVALATLCLAWYTRGLVVATRGLISESKVANARQVGVQTWLELTRRFDSREMLAARARLAKAYSASPRIADEGTEDAKESYSEFVANFFEDLGILYRDQWIDRDLADSSFGFYACRWWAIIAPYVEKERARRDDKSLFEHFKSLAEVTRMDGETINQEEQKRFLEDESTLVDWPL